ncbi:MAG: tRNA 2-selenouridine(34) synthase MnmH [Chitinophagaceae bacterium]|nr:MAG: tRNA 2-selenouridine(34) synthase MnmH [Chitinophagaceae bacterium]
MHDCRFPIFAPVPIRRHLIDEFLLLSKDALLFDVRSQGEYGHAFLPGAVSLPLFSDEERKVIGTAYKRASREQAIKIGLDVFGPKMRAMVETVEQAAAARGLDIKCPVFLYCWRGGMRSGAVAWLLDLYGFEVHVLAGGYKAFRNKVLQAFTRDLPYRIVGGYTGSGKTEMLQCLREAGETVIDLEGLASHKGSAFGNINMPPQPTQEMFENLLAMELLSATGNGQETPPPATPQEGRGASSLPSRARAREGVWLEDESQRIGQLHIPHTLWALMQQAPVYFVDIPFEERLRHIVEEYGALDPERLRDAITRISKRLGPQHAKAAIELLDAGQLPECFAILLRYYDKSYLKGVQGRPSGTPHTVACAAVDPRNALKLLS